MSDAFHHIGDDLSVSSTGDLRLASTSEEGQQRVLRRLLTNSGDYIWHTTYGAGVPLQVGETTSVSAVGALIRGQMLQELGVSVKQIQGGVSCSIRYNDAPTDTTQVIGFNVTN